VVGKKKGKEATFSDYGYEIFVIILKENLKRTHSGLRKVQSIIFFLS